MAFATVIILLPAGYVYPQAQEELNSKILRLLKEKLKNVAIRFSIGKCPTSDMLALLLPGHNIKSALPGFGQDEDGFSR